jgi:tripartite ATP-independent transporter DctP family solute receptor
MHARPRAIFLLVLALAVGAAGCDRGTSRRVVIKASSSSATTEPPPLALAYFGEELAKRTGGRFVTEVYPNNALGSEREVIELTIIGAVEMVCPSNAPLTTFVPELMTLDLPYLFRSRPHMYAVLDGPSGQRFAEPLARRGLKLLGFFEAGLRHLMTRDRQVRRLDDMRGLKIRTMENPLHLAAFRAFGASPIPMAYGEVYTALEQGVIDGAEAAHSNYYSMRFFEVAPHWASIGWMYLVSPLVMSQRFFDRLAPEDQRAIEEAALAAVKWEREEYQRQDRAARERLAAAGVEFSEPDHEAFRKVAERVWRDAGRIVDTELIEAIEKTAGTE